MGFRLGAAVLATVGLIGCQATPRPLPPVPEVVEICRVPEPGHMPERPAWLFDAPEPGGLHEVKRLGGRNQDMYYVLVRDSDKARVCRTRLGMAEEYADKLEQIIRDARHD